MRQVGPKQSSPIMQAIHSQALMLWGSACFYLPHHARDFDQVFKTGHADRHPSYIPAPGQPSIRQQFQALAGPASVDVQSVETDQRNRAIQLAAAAILRRATGRAVGRPGGNGCESGGWGTECR